MLRMFERMSVFGSKRSMTETIHLFSRFTEVAYGVRNALVSDPAGGPINTEALFADARIDEFVTDALAGRRSRFEEEEHKDTVYLAVVDREGNAISFINSLFVAFGSAIVAPQSGVLLQCRGISFSLCEGHVNVIAPRKRPMHTIIPGMLQQNGRAVMPFGVMGGHYQAAGHAHFLAEILERGLDPQFASEQPRHFSLNGSLELENTISDDVSRELEQLGHSVKRAAVPIGGAQAIWIDHARGILIGASDHRKDGFAFGY
jgi:gamma-glutamyltranspeptidase/glutathione hydrolase